MKSKGKTDKTATGSPVAGGYSDLLGQVSGLLEQARRASARSVNAIMTATYWLVGRQLDRQIGTLFCERTALSRNKAKMLTTGAEAKPEDAVTPEGRTLRRRTIRYAWA